MNKEFIPYEQALVLKELGFDEPCFGYYNDYKNISSHSESPFMMCDYNHSEEEEDSINLYLNRITNEYIIPTKRIR